MRIFILDDDEARHDSFSKTLSEHDVVHTYNYDEGCKIVMEQEKFDVFFLDHDLMDFHYVAYKTGYVGATELEFTGYNFVRWMVDEMPVEKRPDLVIVHSWNDYGAARMARDLKDAGFKVHVEEFHTKLGSTLKDNRNG